MKGCDLEVISSWWLAYNQIDDPMTITGIEYRASNARWKHETQNSKEHLHPKSSGWWQTGPLLMIMPIEMSWSGNESYFFVILGWTSSFRTFFSVTLVCQEGTWLHLLKHTVTYVIWPIDFHVQKASSENTCPCSIPCPATSWDDCLESSQQNHW